MSDDNNRALREYAANAILEDSRLRGDLTDEEYGPIQAEALAYVDAAARHAASRAEVERAVAEAKENVRARTSRSAAVPAARSLSDLLRRIRPRL